MIDSKYFLAITEYDQEHTIKGQCEEGYIETMLEVFTDLVNND